MARVFRQKYTYKGEVRQTRKWYVEYRDAGGKVRRVPGYLDKKRTERLGNRLEAEAEGGRSGERPATTGPLEAESVTELLEQFAAHVGLRAAPEQVKTVMARLARLTIGAGWLVPLDLTSQSLEAHLADERRDRKVLKGRVVVVERGMSAQTFNHYLAAANRFARWLVRGKHLRENPFADVEPLNVSGDRRRVRRAEDIAFLWKLIDSVLAVGKTHKSLPADGRAVLYLLAAGTGLRGKECGGLTAAAFDLTADPPTVRLREGHTKNKEEAVIPLHPALAEALAAWLPTRPAAGLLWPGYAPGERPFNRVLRRDLAAAGLPYVRDGEVFDFHALRVLFITELARAKVPLQIAQKLARHSTPALTSNVYSRFRMDDKVEAVGKLPLGRPS